MIIEKINLQIPDIENINAEMLLPENKPDRMMIVIHGLGEHLGRYKSHFADYFLDKKIGLLLFDLPGHGLSSGKKGHINRPIALLEIIDQLIKLTKLRFETAPIFLYGHSFGGEILLWYTLVRSPEVDGVILSAPLIGTKEPVPQIKLFLAKTMDKFFPDFIMKNGIETSMLSKDSHIVESYKSDPLVHDKISAKTGMMIINRAEWIREHAPTNKNKILLMVGDKEAIVNIDEIKHLSGKLPMSELKVWPGYYHELHNEPDKGMVLDYVYNWMKSDGCKK